MPTLKNWGNGGKRTQKTRKKWPGMWMKRHVIVLSWKPSVENVSKEESEYKTVKTFYVNGI